MHFVVELTDVLLVYDILCYDLINRNFALRMLIIKSMFGHSFITF